MQLFDFTNNTYIYLKVNIILKKLNFFCLNNFTISVKILYYFTLFSNNLLY